MAKTPQTRIHLGRGQVTSRDAATWEARRWFFRAVYAVSPETYWSLFPEEPGETALRAYRDQWRDSPYAMICAWQDQWNLPDPWAGEVAWLTIQTRLRWFVKGLTAISGINGATADWFVTPRTRTPDAFGLIGIEAAQLSYNPTNETRPEFWQWLHALIDPQLQSIEDAAALTTTKTKTPKHFLWLARYQVLKEHARPIAATLIDDPDVTHVDITYKARAVQDAIVNTAELIGLELRDDPYRSAKKAPKAKTS